MILNMMAILFKRDNPATVKVAAPAITNNFCQFSEIDLRKMEPKWFDSYEKTGILVVNASKTFMIGFLSKIFYKLPTTY